MLCTAAAISAGYWAGHWAGTQPPAPSPALLRTATLRATQQHPHSPQNSRCSASAPNRAQSSPNMGVCALSSSFPEHHEYLGEEDEH